MTLTEPSVSSASSLLVATVRVAEPVVPIVTVCDPVETPQSPSWLTLTLTVNGAGGAGSAVIVNTALLPSVTPLPAVTLISGSGSSSSATCTVARFCVVETV